MPQTSNHALCPQDFANWEGSGFPSHCDWIVGLDKFRPLASWKSFGNLRIWCCCTRYSTTWSCGCSRRCGGSWSRGCKSFGPRRAGQRPSMEEHCSDNGMFISLNGDSITTRSPTSQQRFDDASAQRLLILRYQSKGSNGLHASQVQVPANVRPHSRLIKQLGKVVEHPHGWTTGAPVVDPLSEITTQTQWRQLVTEVANRNAQRD